MSNGNQRLIRELFNRNKSDLFNYFARRVSREDASDLLQETFVRVLQYDSLHRVADPPAFLQKIAVNLTRDFGRRRKIEARIIESRRVIADAPSGETSPEEKIEFAQKTRLLSSAIETLPPRCHDVFVLCIHDNVPTNEIAKRLGISENAVRKHLRRALLRCRAAVD